MDYFAVLGERRRPWLEPEILKQKFLEKSAAAHPDRVHGASEVETDAAQRRFTELNQAYNKLRSPKERLQHFLELETGAPPAQVQRVPAELMDLAMKLGQVCRRADECVLERAKVTSPLLQVGLFGRAQEWIEQLTELRKQIETGLGELEEALRNLDVEWIQAGEAEAPVRDELLGRLGGVYRFLSYYNRWREQLQERITRLSF